MNTCRTRSLLIAMLIVPIVWPAPPAAAWGRRAHATIARSAVQALPDDMRPFFQTCREYLAEHAQDPDLWRREDAAERNRHYMDIDELTRAEIAALPASLEAAYAALGRRKLDGVGVVPWRVAEFTHKLAQAFRQKDWGEVRRLAPALSHYIADASVPFHCTKNYNGQLTGNLGVHGRFDIELVDRYVSGPFLPVRAARLIQDPFAMALQTVRESNRLVPDCLKADDAARKAAPLDSEQYYLAFHRGAGAIAQRRMAHAAQATADLWLSAWLGAGKPALPPESVIMVLLDRAEYAERGFLDGRLTRIRSDLKMVLPADCTGHDALAIRAIGPKDFWLRASAFGHAADVFAALHWGSGAAASPGLGFRDYALSRVPLSCSMDVLARRYSVTHTAGLNMGIPEAIEQLRSFRRAECSLILLSDGLADDEKVDPRALGGMIAKSGVSFQCYAHGAKALADKRLRALAAAAGVKLLLPGRAEEPGR